ncbi:MAG: ABC transporter ATP-binding protein [Lachnospiraceae bacterium]|nr:ABC transporter ATP-binding protein [Lachnospiraceae bacterium]
MGNLLTVTDLRFSYRNKYQTVHALKEATCTFERGKAYAIMGKSGSGKTTLLSLIAGLETPDGGQILFDGEDTAKMDRDAFRRNNAAVIYQNYNLFPLLTVKENVLYSMKLKGIPNREAEERAEAQLTAVGIAEDQWKRFPPQLSGGEQQRVAIARALAAGNELILADEPTGNLDEENSGQIVEMLIRLAHEEGRCVIVITHDAELASRMDRTYVMRDGVLKEN